MSNSNQNSGSFLVPTGAPGTSLLRARAPGASSRSLLVANRKKSDLPPSNGGGTAGAKVRGGSRGRSSSHLMRPPLTSLLKSCRPAAPSPPAPAVMTPALLKMDRALNLEFMARNANALKTTE